MNKLIQHLISGALDRQPSLIFKIKNWTKHFVWRATINTIVKTKKKYSTSSVMIRALQTLIAPGKKDYVEPRPEGGGCNRHNRKVSV